ncbi:MAG: methylmalonyl-CoA mutase [Planctomycetes bacterium]|nr:methylmalonyl-CoA mutase [Planctomycetota bacterium]
MTVSEENTKKVSLESGIEVKPVYTQEDAKSADIGRPGEFPFTRGIHPLMYRKQPWTMRQYAGFGTPQQTNERFKFLINHGQNALNVAFDLPTQMGLDSDSDEALAEVGRVGMSVNTLNDLEEALSGIPLDKISVSLTINATAPILVAMFFLVAKKQGLKPENIRGTAQNDILKEFIGRGAWIFPVEPSVKIVTDIIEYSCRNYPKYNPVSICGYHVRESGATPAQEIGYAFEIAKCYLERSLQRNLKADDVAGRFSFNFNVYGNLWEQVTKFRAGRRLWAKIIKNEFKAADEKSMLLRMIAGGGGSGLTIQEPENNIIRGAYYALAGALGGTQTMALCCFDEAYTIPSEKASLLSLRTMQILADEVGLCDTVDPLAGSYFVEALTDEMEKKIRESMSEIQSMGGIIKSINEGNLQRKLSAQAYNYERKIRSGETPKVAVNKYVKNDSCTEQKDIQVYQTDKKEIEAQLKRLNKLKSERSSNSVNKALDYLKKSCEQDQNIMPSITDAVSSMATVGEITSAIKSVYGGFKEPHF